MESAIIANREEVFQEDLRNATKNAPKEMEVVVLDLATAQTRNTPFELRFPFKAFRVIDATDNNAYVYFIPYGKGQEQGATGSKYRNNGLFRSARPIPQLTLWWPAQAGKTITIECYRDSESIPGNVNVSTSEVFSSNTTEAAVAATTTRGVVLAQDLDRKIINLRNAGTVRVYVGDVTVVGNVGGATTKIGQYLEPGEAYQYKSSAALYCITDSGTGLLAVSTER